MEPDRVEGDGAPWPVHERTIALPHPVHLVDTLGPLRQGRRDPTVQLSPDGCWRATCTPLGPAAQLVRVGASTGEAHVRAWGPGAPYLLEHAPDLLGCGDLDDGCDYDRHPVVAQLRRRHPGLRVPRSRAVVEILWPAICAQKVTGLEARRSWHGIVRRWGQPAPRPADAGLAAVAPALRLPPVPSALARLPTWAFHELGLEHKRAATIVQAAGAARRLEEAVDLPAEAARRRIEAVPGVGRWTSSEVATVALGDADAVSVGDYWLPSWVTWALAGEARGDDARMLELLEPFRGHRGRIIRLIGRHPGPPRFGPRITLRGFEAQ